MSFSAGDDPPSRDDHAREPVGEGRGGRFRRVLRRAGGRYAPADFGVPPYAPDGPAPRLYAPERETDRRRRGALAVGLAVTAAVLAGGGAVVAAITYQLHAIPAPPADPPTLTPHHTTAAPVDTRLSHEEFGDRDLGRELTAAKVGGWDHPTCDPVDGRGRVLGRNHCDHAAQIAYSARDGKLRAVQLLLAFPTEHRARAAAVSLSKRTSDAIRWRRGGTHAKYAYGKAGVAGAGPYVVVTVVTATGRAGGQAPAFHRVLHSDTVHRFAALNRS
ncbi:MULTISPECIES: hypothetical protein [Nonomuraea]|uniref:Uncharacterized protein n=1 Tax=Nonomuraea ferruginea TaxID=46174 RepID=A0ABT4T5B8_9ACTN|nr:hypothetical protein [Nonomuraea ferruginea]MDA0644464.1 hypothetical protein [Nonomuraea ferruginea]